jgi:hypothetical protein
MTARAIIRPQALLPKSIATTPAHFIDEIKSVSISRFLCDISILGIHVLGSQYCGFAILA